LARRRFNGFHYGLSFGADSFVGRGRLLGRCSVGGVGWVRGCDGREASGGMRRAELWVGCVWSGAFGRVRCAGRVGMRVFGCVHRAECVGPSVIGLARCAGVLGCECSVAYVGPGV
jgi:hypothetical protein